jgi:hypothetical protein
MALVIFLVFCTEAIRRRMSRWDAIEP